MKTMVVGLFFAVQLAAGSVFAVYTCTSAKGDVKVSVNYSLAVGASAQAEWSEVKSHYAKHGLKISQLDTVIDPETEKTLHEIDGNRHSFLVYSADSGFGGVWNLSLEILPQTPYQTEVVLIDQMGTVFKAQVTCNQGRLE